MEHFLHVKCNWTLESALVRLQDVTPRSRARLHNGWKSEECPGCLTKQDSASARPLRPLHFLVPVFPRRQMLGLGVTGALQRVRYGSPRRDVIVLVVKSPGGTEVPGVDRSPRWWTRWRVPDVDTRVR